MTPNLLRRVLTILYLVNVYNNVYCRPQALQQNFIVTTPPSLSDNISTSNIVGNVTQPSPYYDEIDIKSNIQYRYAKTVVNYCIKNPAINQSQEGVFYMVLPSKAFISNFTIHIRGDNTVYVAKVVKKEDAEEIYNNAVMGGQSAGIVGANARDANQITVRLNVEGASKMDITVTYEEFLQRHTKYEHIINVNPVQIVNNFKVNIYINESLPVTNINVPELKTSPNEITSQLENNSIAIIKTNISGNPNWAHIQFTPTIEDQEKMARSIPGGGSAENGMSGQFIVQYDVDRKGQGSDIQILDGYFVHFFAPDHLPALPRHVVFVLDISGSMSGIKMEQTKDAMVTILDDLSDQDYFNILTFSNDVSQWVPTRYINNRIVPFLPDYDYLTDVFGHTTAVPKPAVLTYQGTNINRKEALKFVLELNAGGGTNINSSLLKALKVIDDVALSESIPSHTKPIIIFLTDGEPTVGLTNGQEIRDNVLNANKYSMIPIYGLAFGADADFNLLKSIGTESGAFARRIYEGSDAAIQLEDFYSEIASPLLTNVTFDYVGEYFMNKTKKNINTFFKGSEYVIAGKLDISGIEIEEEEIEIIILGEGQDNLLNRLQYREEIQACPRPLPTTYNNTNANNYSEYSDYQWPSYTCFPWPIPPQIPQQMPRQPKSDAENFIERLWAFLTIENLLDEKLSKAEGNEDIFPNNTTNSTERDIMHKPRSNKEKALDLALQYNFVTRLTSLVVIKPDNNGGFNNGTVINPQPVNSLGIGNPPMFRSSSFSPRSNFPPLGGGGSNPMYNMYPMYDYGSDEYFNDVTSFSFPNNLIPPRISLDSANCSIHMFAKTYLRGTNIILVNPGSSIVPNLSSYAFDDQLTSLKVTGPCCWDIFEEVDFQGTHKRFREGEYKSTSNLGSALTKEASSVKVIAC